MVTYVAIPYQAYHLTHSSLVVGLLSLVEFVPLLVMPLVGGALADAVDRRRLVLLAELLLAAASVLLLANATLLVPRLWVLFVVAGLMAAFDGLQRPPLDALAAAARGPRRADRRRRASPRCAGRPALSSDRRSAASSSPRRAWPAPTRSTSPPSSCRSCCSALMRAVPPPENAEQPSVRGVLDGLRYALSRQELLGTYSVDIIAMFFGMPHGAVPGARRPLRRRCAPWACSTPRPRWARCSRR